MDFSTFTIIFLSLCPYLLGGIIAGFVNGLLGVGGGWLFVPLSFYLLTTSGYDPEIAIQVAVGTSLTTIVATSTSAAIAHSKHGALDIILLKKWLPFLILGGISGGILAQHFSSDTIRILFATVLFYNAINMIIRSHFHNKALEKPSEETSFHAKKFHKNLHWGVHGIIAYSLSSLASLIGIGGGALSVPILTSMKMPIHRAIATASAINISLTLPAAITFAIQGLGISGRPPFALGYVNLAVVPFTIITGLISVRFGVRTAHGLNITYLKRFFGYFMLFLSINLTLSTFNIDLLSFLFG